ncbi:MAG TPA: VOC family protein [Acidimicrobiales bacterium]
MPFHAYLFYSDGKCREAFTRYQEIFGGELNIMSFADLPDGADTMPGAKPEHVMHAALIHSDGLLMGSDDPSGDGGPRLGISVSYTAPDIETGRKAFEAIVEGGEVQMPFESTFWSPGFGGGVDRWGVSWMVDVATDEASA